MFQYQIIPVTSFEENCSIIWCDETKEAAFIDPGGEPELLQNAVEKLKVNIKQILLTHGHLDHVGAAVKLAEHFNVKIIGPNQEDEFLFNSLPQQSMQFGFPYTEAFLPDRWLQEGDQIHVGKTVFDVLFCPGHTPGHIVFINHQDRLAFVGDVLFKGSVGRTDFPRGNHASLISAITNKLLPLGDDFVFIPGHGPMSTFGNERISNPYLI
ncbi:MBL fold metallo-hydrolase [uncultured Gilliamella sp.]|jgi:Zn-dependent hydrolases, including glyoxylases|uniref:MBL fold metallo-hydrolase n=1 Tax=uncultured Gilliamella sp. TaxID=1193505 RepID=UPI0025DF1734|nr:MBL fold metallo-hydrolase [uncultured Gilliamella sp.]